MKKIILYFTAFFLLPTISFAQVFKVEDFIFKVNEDFITQLSEQETDSLEEVSWSTKEKSVYVNSLGKKVRIDVIGNYAKLFILKVDNDRGWTFEKQKRNTYYIEEFAEGFSGKLKLKSLFGRIYGAKLYLYQFYQPSEEKNELAEKLLMKSCTIKLDRLKK